MISGVVPEAIFKIRTEAELQDAIDEGLRETHYIDFKSKVGTSDQERKGFAQDVAALAIDGGVLIVGVSEPKEPEVAPPERNPVDLTKLAERLTQIALMRPDEGVRVRTWEIPTAEDPSRGYLFIHVPPSPRAPHMVEGRYYGRNDKTNYRLSDAEVRRLHALQLAAQRDIIADAHELLQKLSGGRYAPPPMMLLLAVPSGGRVDDPLVPLLNLSDNELRSTVLELVRAAAIPEHQQNFVPTFQNPSNVVRRAGGVAATTRLEDEQFLDSEKSAELRVNENGTVFLASRRTVIAPIPSDSPQVLESLIIGHTDLVVRLAPLLSERYGFAGGWRFGLIVIGLHDAISNALAHTGHASWDSRGPKFTDDVYERATEASLLELTQSPEQVVGRLVSKLLRSLNSHQLSQWSWIPLA